MIVLCKESKSLFLAGYQHCAHLNKFPSFTLSRNKRRDYVVTIRLKSLILYYLQLVVCCGILFKVKNVLFFFFHPHVQLHSSSGVATTPRLIEWRAVVEAADKSQAPEVIISRIFSSILALPLHLYLATTPLLTFMRCFFFFLSADRSPSLHPPPPPSPPSCCVSLLG